eukprot:CAMPEP_0114540874 /NCGR_PEP_ID=MMETSP0114-20121206/1004_1 /TAXON_ID=31324 /ORGANISM="Goniomonas sp, Strain m" /LENGTH=57 /DNA_ID=CAMNT_0001725073 /DNA_START=223 /DNA_END=396 /DNA_ORIENTATION=+
MPTVGKLLSIGGVVGRQSMMLQAAKSAAIYPTMINLVGIDGHLTMIWWPLDHENNPV